MEQLYNAIGGSYEQVRRRLMSDAMIERFVLRFPDDPSFAALGAAMAEQDAANAFAAVHTLKGLALTLAFEQLGSAASALTEALRDQTQPMDWMELHAMFSAVEKAYTAVISAIRAYRKQ